MDQNSQMQTQPTNRSTTPVLVIDDEESIVDLIKLGLKYEGFEVVAASDGEEGIAAAQRTNPIFIILDRMLPDMDGLEVCRRLRSNPTTLDIPILLLTAKDEVGSRVEGLNTGADDYLTKPFSYGRKFTGTKGRRYRTQYGHPRSYTCGASDRFNSDGV